MSTTQIRKYISYEHEDHIGMSACVSNSNKSTKFTERLKIKNNKLKKQKWELEKEIDSSKKLYDTPLNYTASMGTEILFVLSNQTQDN